MDWTEKYRPQTLDGVVGNPTAVNSLRAWARSWEKGIPEVRVAVLRGPPGVGKTTSVEALAREMGWSIIEMNASDQRTGKAIEDVALRGSRFETFRDDGSFTRSSEGGRKLIVLDEADNFYGNSDKGAMPVVNSLIKETRQPVVLIVNDFYELSRKSSAVNDSTLQITFKKPQAGTIAKALYRIAEAEGVEVEPAAMEIIAENANGDMRAAVRNLESLALGQDVVTQEMADGLSPRDTRSDIYDLMKAVFLGGDPAEARRRAMEVDEDPGMVLMWIDENMPTECTDTGDLIRGYEKLSRADIFMSRVYRRQYYRFWSYAKDLMTFGVCASKRTRSRPGTRINFPSYLGRMSRSKKVRMLRGSISLKLAEHLHTTTRRVQNDVVPYVRTMISNDADLRLALTDELDLDADELGLLMAKKADSKAVTSVIKEVEALRLKRIATAVPKEQPTVSIDIPVPRPRAPAKDPSPEPAKATVQKAEPSKPKTTKANGQRSLFDFGYHGPGIPRPAHQAAVQALQGPFGSQAMPLDEGEHDPRQMLLQAGLLWHPVPQVSADDAGAERVQPHVHVLLEGPGQGFRGRRVGGAQGDAGRPHRGAEEAGLGFKGGPQVRP